MIFTVSAVDSVNQTDSQSLTDQGSWIGRVMFRNQSGCRYTFNVQLTDRGCVQEQQQALDQFLSEVERSAYRMAEIATRNPDDALDIVQDAMIKLVEKYADKPQEEWRPLFFTILHSRITDYHRRNTLTGRIFAWASRDDEGGDDLDQYAIESDSPLERVTEQLTLDRLNTALEDLPTRQQQVFLLRTWQGFSVAETAQILKCSEGSVKTHLSRATDTLMKSVEKDSNHD